MLDDESDAAVVFNQIQASLREADATYYLPLEIEGTPSGAVQVTIETIDSTAHEGVHYQIENKEFIIGADFKGIPVTLIDDKEVNEDRMFFVRIVSVVGAMKITSKSICTVIIKNDDLGIRWGKDQTTIEENPRGALLSIPVYLKGDPGKDLKIRVEQTGGTLGADEYTLENGNELIIPQGQDSVLVKVRPVYNPEINDDKTLKLEIVSVEDHEELAGGTCEVTVYNYDAQLTLGRAQYKVGELTSSLSLPVSLSQPLKHDVRFKLPENDLYYTDQTEITIPAGSTQVTIDLNLNLDRPESFDISLASMTGIAEQHIQTTSVTTVANSTNPQKTDWTLTCDSEEPNSAVTMIDGKENTYWHSRWSNGTDPLPYTIVIDVKKQMGWRSIEIFRGPRFDLMGCTLEVSTDQNNWTMLGRLDFPLASETPRNGRTLTVEKYAEGRYLRIIVDKTKTTDKNLPAQIAEVNIEGWTIE